MISDYRRRNDRETANIVVTIVVTPWDSTEIFSIGDTLMDRINNKLIVDAVLQL